MVLPIELGTAAASRVQDAVQGVLIAHDMASNDDQVMAEYVTVMIANSKSMDAIAEELRELVGGELDASVPAQIWARAEAAARESQADMRAASPRARSPSQMQDAEFKERTRARWNDTARPARAERGAERSLHHERELFPAKGRRNAKIERGMHSDAMPAQLSIFGRAGVPDPHAMPFVPEGMPPFSEMMAAMGGPSLFTRLDPMMPNNPPVDLHPTVTNVPRDMAAFPSRPEQRALCRYSVHCTNPLCVYSHPTPANAGNALDERALVLSEEACENGDACTHRECVKSHVSPSVTLIKAKGVAPPPPAARCRFQQQCLNPGCTYTHYDDSGRLTAAPAATQGPCRFSTQCTRPDCHYTHPPRSKTVCRYGDACKRFDCVFTHPRDPPVHATADRLAAFAATHEGKRERILPGESAGQSAGAMSVTNSA
ncbi:mRNA-binding protein nab2 [Malassezia vespertilionis]|uniref:mRNA-binding protein nab2 n=1 Tax=Malassezia vespertilionis TaxID=2020962 RepID=UPI0024B256B5|nr:mRNA-binding protein nab2 [Malassezia vespertilionis]WFD04868.1 mRNA-binding protein nab2 [Malassezia vespertilionis]